jgi:hypothetical protein
MLAVACAMLLGATLMPQAAVALGERDVAVIDFDRLKNFTNTMARHCLISPVQCAEMVCGATATTMTKCDGRTNVPAMCFMGIAGPEIPNIRQVQ